MSFANMFFLETQYKVINNQIIYFSCDEVHVIIFIADVLDLDASALALHCPPFGNK